jgi:hypothetical protein
MYSVKKERSLFTVDVLKAIQIVLNRLLFK